MSKIRLNPEDYEKQVIEYLNSKESGSRVHSSIDLIEIIDDEYYRVETNFTDKYILEDYDEMGVYVIDKKFIS